MLILHAKPSTKPVAGLGSTIGGNRGTRYCCGEVATLRQERPRFFQYSPDRSTRNAHRCALFGPGACRVSHLG
jgi:hypothetical protein